jgi:hypothetical protein
MLPVKILAWMYLIFNVVFFLALAVVVWALVSS